MGDLSKATEKEQVASKSEASERANQPRLNGLDGWNDTAPAPCPTAGERGYITVSAAAAAHRRVSNSAATTGIWVLCHLGARSQV